MTEEVVEKKISLSDIHKKLHEMPERSDYWDADNYQIAYYSDLKKWQIELVALVTQLQKQQETEIAKREKSLERMAMDFQDEGYDEGYDDCEEGRPRKEWKP